ncbi:hypothetical protein KUTeg_003058 [Tegillarca granosa]|uniref:Uncharacterized protein n=1 Tax=Tegillarca granosa TaxID=220873 RepID=A0ABQ9FPV3_TEGGR|nr:hypothetical protein KUTeg_003058 [Tegillarca granosa]
MKKNIVLCQHWSILTIYRMILSHQMLILSWLAQTMCTSPSLKALNKFQTDHSLAVLLGVERSEYLQIVSVQEGQSLRKWQIFNTQANEHSVRSLLMKIIELYETVHNDDVELDDPYDFLPDPKPVLPSRTVGQKQVPEKEKENEKYFDDFTVTCSIESPEDEKQYDNPTSNKLLATLIPHTGAERCAFLLLDNKPVGKVKIITDCNEEIEAERVRKTLYKVTLKGSSSADQWPTLLHFGAEFNLIKFCKELLNLPRSLESCNIMNNAKEIPFDIAQHKNYRELADMLEQYMEQQWQCNDPGNKDSGIEPDTPLPHGSGYMAMNPDMAPTVPEHLPVLHRESTYIEMDKIHVGDDDSDNGEYIFGDDEPSEPPTPHMIKYVNTEIKEAQTNVIPDIVFGEKGDVDRQTNPKEKHAYHLQKSHSESDARDLDFESCDYFIDCNRINRDFNYLVAKQGAPRKSSIMKKIGGMFLRKNSLVDQDCIIHEEKTKKRDKKKGKLKHQDSTDSTRISDISTSSTESK